MFYFFRGVQAYTAAHTAPVLVSLALWSENLAANAAAQRVPLDLFTKTEAYIWCAA